MNSTSSFKRPAWMGLTPLLVFLVTYLLSSIILQDFYKVPLSVAFILTSVYAVFITPRMSLEERLAHFSKGASDRNILLMIWIFIFSGAFAYSAKSMGAVDAVVQGLLYVLPDFLILPGLFLVSCFVSISIGTSVGTIVALAPIAIGMAEPLGVDKALVAGLILGGAFFGDNLSFISDTTIAATRLLGCQMADKFRANIRIALPAAVVAFFIYLFLGLDVHRLDGVGLSTSPWLILPYLVVLVCALCGVNVILVLLYGIFSVGLIGILCGQTDLWGWIGSLGEGINSMGELIIVTLLAGGLLEMIRLNGGFDYMINTIRRWVHSRRSAEVSIAALVSISDLCTANNTIAILSVGAMVKEIVDHYKLSHRRAASILDIFSCIVQSLIPYGAQMLLISKIADIAPLSIVPYQYYTMLLLVFSLISIYLYGNAKPTTEPRA